MNFEPVVCKFRSRIFPAVERLWRPIREQGGLVLRLFRNSAPFTWFGQIDAFLSTLARRIVIPLAGFLSNRKRVPDVVLIRRKLKWKNIQE